MSDLSINQQSIDALLEFADSMVTISQKLDEDITALMQIYHSVAPHVGPHEAEFAEMLRNINTAEQYTDEAVKELSCMLRSTAEKMQFFLWHGSSYGSVNLGHKDIKDRYQEATNKRLNSTGTNPVARDLYEEYATAINIVDYDYAQTPFYNFIGKSIKLNAMADLHNTTGAMSHYFHEVGHMLDDFAGNGHAWLSSDPEFGKSLRQDVEAYINATMFKKHCDKDEAYDIISEELAGPWNAGISDIFGSLTACMCQGDWGHIPAYWEADPSRIEKEAFANMFEASIGDERKKSEMIKYLPRAYAQFERIIRSR